MAKKVRTAEPPVSVPGRGSEQFALRLPTGLRDRIKAYAERQGRSMNTEIVRILEKEFPEPWSLLHRLLETAELAQILREGVNDERVDRLRDDIHQTLNGIVSGQVLDIDDRVREHIRERLRKWELDQEFEDEDRYTENLDQGELDSFWKHKSTAKFEKP